MASQCLKDYQTLSGQNATVTALKITCDSELVLFKGKELVCQQSLSKIQKQSATQQSDLKILTTNLGKVQNIADKCLNDK